LSYPLAVPPARGGLAPQISLSYSSSGGNGWLGVGWDLSLGYIQRRGPRKGVPKYNDTEDVFELTLGGAPQELVPIGGNAYRLRIEGAYLKIQYYTSGNFWAVWDKSGTMMRFGYTQSSKIGTIRDPSVSTNTYRWCLEWVVDPKSNNMEITYVRDEDEWGNIIQVYPEEIIYNANDVAGLPHNHSVTFILDSSRTDTPSNYRGGFKMLTRKRLSSIEVKTGVNLVRKYQFAYDAPNARSVLASITLYGDDNPPPSPSLPPTSFTYQTHNPGVETGISWANPGWWWVDDGYGNPWYYGLGIREDPHLNGTIADVLDIDGDGVPERVVHDKTNPYDTWEVYHNNLLSGFITKQDGSPWTWANPMGMDYYDPETGDSSGNFIKYYHNLLGTYIDNIDMNGDGLPDRVGTTASPYSWNVYFNNGNGFNTAASWSHPSGDPNNYYGNFIRDADAYGSVRSDVIDMNGDGRPDRVVYGNPDWRVYFNTGSSFEANYFAWPAPAAYSGYWIRHSAFMSYEGYAWTNRVADMVDMNGDGLPDRVVSDGASWFVFFNNGSGFDQGVTWANSTYHIHSTYSVGGSPYTTSMLVDMNGDGLPDLVAYPGQGSWTVYLNTGSGFSAGVDWPNTDGYITEGIGNAIVDVFDINGDGLPDKIRAYAIPGSPWTVYRNNGPVADLLSVVNNGIGGSIQIEYQPSTDYDNTGGDGKWDLPYIVQTVSRVSQNDGRNHSYTTEYDCEGGYYDPAEVEFRGFRKVTTCQPNCASFESKTETWYHQLSYYKKGKVETQLLTSKLTEGHTRRVDNTWDEWQVWNQSSKFARLLETNSTITDHGAYSYSHRTVYGYDSTLNVWRELKYGATPEETVQTYFNYKSCPDTWIFSKPTRIMVLDSDNGIVSTKWMDYDCATGNITKEEVCKSDTPNDQYTGCYYSNEGQNSVIHYEYYDGGHLPNTGNLRRTQDPNGNWTEVTYDYYTQTHVYQTANALSHVTRTVYDPGTGSLTQLIPPYLLGTGFSFTYTYDPFGRKEYEYRPDGGFTKYTYVLGDPNNWGQYVQKWEHIEGGPSDLEHYSTSYFDGMGRTYSVWSSGPGGKFIGTMTEFDPLGRVYSKTNPYFYNPTPPPGSYDPAYNTIFTYDGLSRVIKVEMPDTPANTFINTTYQGLRKVVQNQRGFFTAYTYDVYQRLTKVEEYDHTGALYSTTEYKYDTMGNLIEVKAAVGMPEQNTITMTYDSQSKKRFMSDPDMGGDDHRWEYRYDKSGNLVYQRDGKNQEISFTYDALNRVTEKTYVNTNPAERVTYCYDDPAYCIPPYPPDPPVPPVPFSKGALIRVLTLRAGNPEVEVATDRVLAYDELQRVKQSIKKIEVSPGAYEEVTFEKTYDSAGSPITVKSIGALLTKQYNYEYDVAGNLLHVKDNGTQANVVTYSDFTAVGQPRGATFSNGAVTTYGYYPQTGRLNTLFTTRLGVTTYQNLSYGYDGKGNITAISDYPTYYHTGTISHTFTYDALDRLATAAGTGSNWYNHTYQYDRIGNITYKSEVGASGSNTYTYTYDYPIRPHAVKTVVADTPVYNDPLINIEYNYDQKPKLIKRNLVDYIRFTYDGSGGRVRKENLATPQTTLYFGELYEKRGTVEIVHVFAGNRRVASIRSDGNDQFYHPNHLGSASVVTGQDGIWRERIEYHPFGTYLVDEKNSSYPNFPDANYTFTDQEDDDDIGLYNYGARLYDPVIGRFVSPDRIVQAPENPQSLNRYSYCLNNPLIYTDPSGEDPLLVAIIVGAILGAFMGAVEANMAGTSILKGAAIGGLIGAASGAAGGWVGGAVTDFLTPSVYASASAANIVGVMAGGFTAGAISGGANAAINGGNPWKAALYGGLMGAAITGVIQGAVELNNMGGYGSLNIRCPNCSQGSSLDMMVAGPVPKSSALAEAKRIADKATPDQRIMGYTIYGEAGGGTYEDKLGVGWTMRNRYDAGSGYSYKDIADSWFAPQSALRKINPGELASWRQSFQAAGEVLSATPGSNPIPGVTHFHDKSITFPWPKHAATAVRVN